jgi:hypothetical protein
MTASPPLAPAEGGPFFYFVLCDFGPDIGRSYLETDPDKADRETVLTLLMRSEYTGPVQVLEVDWEGGRARDVSSEFAEEIIEWSTLDDLSRMSRCSRH